MCQPEPRDDESGSSSERPVGSSWRQIRPYIYRGSSQNVWISRLSIENPPIVSEIIVKLDRILFNEVAGR